MRRNPTASPAPIVWRRKSARCPATTSGFSRLLMCPAFSMIRNCEPGMRAYVRISCNRQAIMDLSKCSSFAAPRAPGGPGARAVTGHLLGNCRISNKEQQNYEGKSAITLRMRWRKAPSLHDSTFLIRYSAVQNTLAIRLRAGGF